MSLTVVKKPFIRASKIRMLPTGDSVMHSSSHQSRHWIIEFLNKFEGNHLPSYPSGTLILTSRSCSPQPQIINNSTITDWSSKNSEDTLHQETTNWDAISLEDGTAHFIWSLITRFRILKLNLHFVFFHK